MQNLNMLDEKVCEKLKKLAKSLRNCTNCTKRWKNCTTALYTEKFPKNLESTAKPLTDGLSIIYVEVHKKRYFKIWIKKVNLATF